MKLGRSAGALLFIFFLASIPLFASTKIIHRWVLTGVPLPHFQKMLVAGIMENYVVRQEFEDQMKKVLSNCGVEGVQSYLVLPPSNEMMEGELKQRIKESAFDSVLVLRLKEVRQEPQEAVRTYVPPPGYYTFWPYWNMAYGNFTPNSSGTTDKTVVRLEFNLYGTKDERLVWSGETGAIYSKDFEKLGKEYAQALVNRLRKDKIIRRK